MISLAIEAGLTAVMRSHLYKFNQEVFLQKEGGPIGLKLTGAISRVFMLWWDREFLKRVESMTINLNWKLYMYSRYVDDCNCLGEAIPT